MKNEILPPTYFLVILVLLVGFHFILPVFKLNYSPYNWLGSIFIVFGIILNLWADNLFKKEKTTVKPNEKPSFLVISGPFLFSRHPMYLGMAMFLLGTAVFLGSLISFVFPVIFVILMQKIFIPKEEENLESVFSQQYLDYKKRVRSWI